MKRDSSAETTYCHGVSGDEDGQPDWLLLLSIPERGQEKECRSDHSLAKS